MENMIKKGFFMIAALILLVPAVLAEADSSVDTYTLPSNPDCAGITGDLNDDGLVNEYDREVIQNTIAGKEGFDACADYDGDGIISPSDHIGLKKEIVNIEKYGIVLEPKALPALDAAGSKCRKGDVNADGKVDYKDIGLAKEMVAGTIPSSMCADTNNDHIISPNDILTIKMMEQGSYVDRDPYIYPVGNFSINESETLTFQVNGIDMENDDIVYSAANLPAGAVFDSQTFSWTPNSTQAGNYTVTFIADDGYGSSEINVSIEVLDIEVPQPENHAPVFEQVDDIVMYEADVFWFQLNATDADGDNITYSAENLPEGSYFWTDELGGIFSGTFVWNPQYGDSGNYTVTFTASDGQLNTAMDVSIEVIAVPEDEQMHVVLSSDAISGTENLTVNFTCAVENGTGPYSYSWNVMDSNGTAYASAIILVSENVMQFNETLHAGNWTAVCYVTDNGRTVISNKVIISVNESANNDQDDDDQGEDDDSQGEDNNDQDNDNDEENSGGDHHSSSSGILYAPKTASGSTQKLKLVEKDSNSDATAQTPAEPDNNKEGLMTITGEAVQDNSTEASNAFSALKIAGIMLWIFAVLLAGMLVYGKVQQRKTDTGALFR